MRAALVAIATMGAMVGAAPGVAAAERLDHLEYEVLTPPGYASAQLRYPVVYVVPGSGEGPGSAAKTLGLSAYAAQGRAIVVVVAEADHGQSNFIVNWADGTTPLDSDLLRVIDAVDAGYRTRADGAHRAIGGYSAGGYSAMAVASRHPGLFRSAASFSGLVDLTWIGAPWQEAFEALSVAFYGPDGIYRRWGEPVSKDANWHAENPTDLAGRLVGLRGVYIAAGDGTPSSPGDVAAAGPGLGPEAAQEVIVGDMTRRYDAALTRAGVPHVYRPHHGLHQSSNWRTDLARWWPLATKAIGRPQHVRTPARPKRHPRSRAAPTRAASR